MRFLLIKVTLRIILRHFFKRFKVYTLKLKS